MADIDKQINYSVMVTVDSTKKLKRVLNDATDKILDYKPAAGRIAVITVSIIGTEIDE